MSPLRLSTLAWLLFAATPPALADGAPLALCELHAASDPDRCLRLLENLSHIEPDTFDTFASCAAQSSSANLSACFTPDTLDALSRARFWLPLHTQCLDLLDTDPDSAAPLCHDALTLAPSSPTTRLSAATAALAQHDCDTGLQLLASLDPTTLDPSALTRAEDLARSCSGGSEPPDLGGIDTDDLDALCTQIALHQPDTDLDGCAAELSSLRDMLGGGPVWDDFATCFATEGNAEACMTEDVMNALTGP